MNDFVKLCGSLYIFITLLVGASLALATVASWLERSGAPWLVWLTLVLSLLAAGLVGALAHAYNNNNNNNTPKASAVVQVPPPSKEVSVEVLGTYADAKGIARTDVRLESGHTLEFAGYYGPPGVMVKVWERGGDFFRTDPNAGGTK